jgi:GNAT superfamily N-acetyltransferase
MNMNVTAITLPEVLCLKTDADFSEKIWLEYRAEALALTPKVIQTKLLPSLTERFDFVPFTTQTHHMLSDVNSLLEQEFPRHGAAMHFLLSTLPLRGLFDPILNAHAYHNCLQYWVCIDKQNGKGIGTVGAFLGSPDHERNVWGGWLAVDREYRNFGIGMGLIEFVVGFGQLYGEKHGQKYIRLLTSDEPHVAKARELYKAWRCREVQRFPNPYIPGATAIVMETELADSPRVRSQN